MRIGITVLPNHYINSDVWFPLEIFLSDWLSNMCKEDFTIVKESTPANIQPVYSIIFNHPEDATLVKLRDLPADLSKYIRLN